MGSEMCIRDRYLADRLWTNATTRRCSVLDASPTADGTAITLKLRRPVGFRFVAGQYVQMRVSTIDGWWHPVSIGSGTRAPYLTFVIQVRPGRSWTQRLASPEVVRQLRLGTASVCLRGPFGHSIASEERSDALLAIGTSTGIVPMLSLLEDRVAAVTANEHVHVASSRRRGAIGFPPTVSSSQRHASCNADAPPPLEADSSHDRDSVGPERAMLRSHHRRHMFGSRKRLVLSIDMSRLSTAFLLLLCTRQLRQRERMLTSRGTAAPYFRALRAAARSHWGDAAADVLGFWLILFIVATVGLLVSWGSLPGEAQQAWQPPMLQLCSALWMMGYCAHLTYRLTWSATGRRRMSRRVTCWRMLDTVLILVSFGLLIGWGLDGAQHFVRPTHAQHMLRIAMGAYFATRLIQSSPELRAARATRRRAAAATDVGYADFHLRGESGSFAGGGSSTLDLVWISPSADLCASYLPHLCQTLGRPVEHSSSGGRRNSCGRTSQLLVCDGATAVSADLHPAAPMPSSRLCLEQTDATDISLPEFVGCHRISFSIYVTDKDQSRVAALKQAARGTIAEGRLFFRRPNLQRILDTRNQACLAGHLQPSIPHGERTGFSTAVTFCGNPAVANECQKASLVANRLAAALDAPQVVTTFRKEYYAFCGPTRRRAWTRRTKSRVTKSRAIEVTPRDNCGNCGVGLVPSFEGDDCAVSTATAQHGGENGPGISVLGRLDFVVRA